jgi:hypothetical protein
LKIENSSSVRSTLSLDTSRNSQGAERKIELLEQRAPSSLLEMAESRQKSTKLKLGSRTAGD